MAAEDGEIAKTEEVSSCLQAIAMCHLLIAFLLPTSRFVLICCACRAVRALVACRSALQLPSSRADLISSRGAKAAIQPPTARKEGKDSSQNGKAPASSAADMTDMDNPEYLAQVAATFAPGG